ncbi:MAG: type II and III secretion system protein [Betaproteobacteria bacterium]|nr:type II and III secretion system protein [Betaproteobacteria bacterium]
MNLGMRAALGVVLVLAGACAQAPLPPSPQHIRADEPRPEGVIPPPVQVAPVLPKPTPTLKPETYSVVVNRVPAQELLFALARDAKLQIDIDPSLTGLVTLNAVDQTLPQLLTRIARQIDMRYEIDGQTLVVMRDTPYLRAYKIDYLSANRNVAMRTTASTQFGAASATAGGTGSPTATGATSTIEVTSQNHLWESIVQNVREILRETDRILPAPPAGSTTAASAGQPSPAPAAPTPAPAPTPAGSAPAAPGSPAGAPASGATFQEAASVIANRESGVLYVRANSKQQERVQEFLDQVMAGAKRQVLIEATVAEVQLRNEYQRGIDWQRLSALGTGIRLSQPQIPPPTGFNPNPFLIGYTSASGNFSFNIRLLEQFGDVRVLSSPKLSVLNNQTAVLRVTRDIIYFTITPSTQPITIAAGGTGVTLQASFTTTPNVAAEGFMMAVLPQINDAESVVLNVKPTIRRQVGSARDPNPALQGQITQNDIPLFETREFDSILRLQSGDVAVLAGLMQDQTQNTDTNIPGVRTIPIIGDVLSQRADLTQKTELVIFLRATVVKDPSVDGDFRSFREQLPREDFFRRPSQQKTAPLVRPGKEQP